MLFKNYIPHKTPFKPNYNKWFNEYEKEIINLYSIFQEIINDRYQYEKIDWESHKIFILFSIMLYNKSSKYIPVHIVK